MGSTFVYNLGFLFTMILCLDMGAAALWSVGRKEQVRKRHKRHKGQRWYAYRLWLISCFLKSLLFYVAVAAFLNGTLL